MRKRLPTFAAILSLTVLFTLSPAPAARAADPPKEEAKDKKDKKPDVAADINKPRADARTIAFEASEGTWMSVDVSPDGQTVVFDLLGDIYAMPIAGGRAKPLTSGPAWDYHPRFSPDGKTIAFTSDRSGIENVWIMDADGGNPRAVTAEKDEYVRSAAWTPDGNYLIARKETGKRAGIPPVELWIYNREGGGGIKLTSSDDVNDAGGAVVSRDGRSIYFSARQRRFSYTPDLNDGLWQIWRYDRELADTFPIAEGFGGAVRPALSPDGKTLTYVSRRDGESVLVARDLATGSERILARDVTRDEEEGFAQADLWPNYAFTPDGKSLVFSNKGKIVRLDLASLAIREIPFTAPVSLAVAPRVTWQEKVESGPVVAKILRWPSQSPDGEDDRLRGVRTHLAAAARRRKGLGGAEAAHEGRRRAAEARVRPDLVARREVDRLRLVERRRGRARLEGAGRRGGAPVKLTKIAGHYANPAWSPKGDKIALVRGSGLEFRGHQPEEEEFFEAVVLDAAGGELKPVVVLKLANALHYHPEVFWSGDGTRLYYRDPIELKKPTDDPKNDLVSVRLDGTDRRHLMRFPPVDDIEPSPDGQWVVFTSRDNVYVTALPGFLMKEPPEVSLKEGAIPVYRLSDDAGGYVRWADGGKTITWALGNTFYRLPIATAVEFAREQHRKAEEKEKKEAAEKDADAVERQGEGREGEGEGPGGAGPHGRDDRDRGERAAREADRVVRAPRRARRDDEGRRGPPERGHRRDRQPHRRGRRRPGASRCRPARGASTEPARPSSPASSTRMRTCTTRASSSSRRRSGSTWPTSPTASPRSTTPRRRRSTSSRRASRSRRG